MTDNYVRITKASVSKCHRCYRSFKENEPVIFKPLDSVSLCIDCAKDFDPRGENELRVFKTNTGRETVGSYWST